MLILDEHCCADPCISTGEPAGSYPPFDEGNPSWLTLKGPKREIFDSGVFAQIRPIWIGDLGTRPKNY